VSVTADLYPTFTILVKDFANSMKKAVWLFAYSRHWVEVVFKLGGEVGLGLGQCLVFTVLVMGPHFSLINCPGVPAGDTGKKPRPLSVLALKARAMSVLSIILGLPGCVH